MLRYYGSRIVPSIVKFAQKENSGLGPRSTPATALGKTAFYRRIEMDLSNAHAYTSEVMTRNMLAHDAEEGIDAFIQKRKPVWRDE
jgi:enoyl-CoA hydratase/carnithine racemase